MGSKLVVLTIYLLGVARLWSTVSCKDVEKPTSHEDELREFITNFQKYDEESVQKKVLTAMENLWTIYLTELEKSNSTSAYNISDKCHKSAMSILEYDSQTYIPLNITVPGPRLTTLLDATGKQGAGLLTGNVILDGAFDECFNYNYTGYCVAKSVSLSPEVETHIPVAWTIGMCVPKGCNSTDISLLINETKILQADQVTIKCLDSKYPDYNVGAIIMLIITGIFVLLVFVGTVVDNILMHARNIFENQHTTISSAQSDRVALNNANINDLERTPLLVVKRARSRYEVQPSEFITAFSVFKTVPTLLATKQTPTVITSLNGLRVISMFWVILGHTQFWVFEGVVTNVDNRLNSFTLFSRFTFQAVESAFFAVDSFFFLSAVLVAYLTLREMRKRKGRFPYLEFYVHRYFRLTPTYAFVLFFAWFLTTHITSGPGITGNTLSKTCTSYWWTNFLYINNFYPWRLADECLGWTWYLANDMQFYVISPLIIIAAYHLLPLSLIICGLFLASGFIITGAIAGIYDFQANMFSVLAYGYASKPGVSATYVDAIYIKPWDRIAPYVVGLALGYILYRDHKFCFNRITNAILYALAWAIAAFVAFWIVYGLYFTWHGHVPVTAENIIYITFSRFLWALCLAAMVFACHNGYGWFINAFLSMKIWTPLARMTFNAYLVHPILLTLVYGQLQTTIHYTNITMACYTVSFVVLSYGVAAIICVFVELPLGTVEMLVFKAFGYKGRNSQRQDVKIDFDEIKEPLNSVEPNI